MANLIITIISIGLVAVAAIMGAYYGGTAFVQGQAKAYANTAVAQGDQINAAWTVFAAQNGGSFTPISSVANLSNLSSPNTSSTPYLASIPIPPPQVANSAWPASTWAVTDLTSITSTSPPTVPGTTTANTGGVYFRLTDDTNGANTCNYVAQIAAGANAYPTGINTSTNLLAGGYVSTSTANATRKFDCVYYASVSTNTSAPSTSTTPKYVYYRTF